jgi:hypothetical protein
MPASAPTNRAASRRPASKSVASRAPLGGWGLAGPVAGPMATLKPVLLALGLVVAIAASAVAQERAKPDSSSTIIQRSIEPNQQARVPSPGSERAQPRGATGPLETTSGGESAASPQGDAPPGMQAPQSSPAPGLPASKPGR